MQGRRARKARDAMTNCPEDVISVTVFADASATNTLPKASPATPVGALNPVATVDFVPFVNFKTLLLAWSATRTLPNGSTAMPAGFKVDPTALTLPGSNAAAGPIPIPDKPCAPSVGVVVLLSVSAPGLPPGRMGVKVYSITQVVAVVTASPGVQVSLPASVNSVEENVNGVAARVALLKKPKAVDCVADAVPTLLVCGAPNDSLRTIPYESSAM